MLAVPTTNVLVLLLVLLSRQGGTSNLPDTIPIGFLLDGSSKSEQVALEAMVDSINDDMAILPSSLLAPKISTTRDGVKTSVEVCDLMRSGVAAIFGPQSPETASHVQSLCDTMEIPHLEARWNANPRMHSNSLNLYPHPPVLSKAYADLVRAWGWKSLTIIYENSDGLARLQEMLKMTGIVAKFRQLGAGPDHRPILQDIKVSGENHIVLDCERQHIRGILRQAQQIGLMSDYHSYLITSLDLHTLDLDDFKYSGTNITAFRLLGSNKLQTSGSTNITTEMALMYDAVHVFTKTLNDYNPSEEISFNPVTCDGSETMENGARISTLLRKVEMSGLTGVIKFDNQGFRSSFVLDIVELGRDGLKGIGSWNSSQGVHFTRTFGEEYTQIVESLHDKTMVVTVVPSVPYVMRKYSGNTSSDTEEFIGFGIDLIEEVSKILGFKYVVRVAPQSKYGTYNPLTKEWNGMIRELLEKRADLAVSDLTITYERDQAVDFTVPFLTTGISILYRKPIIQPPNLFSFLAPLSCDIWIYTIIAFLGVSTLLFFLAKFSPFEVSNNPLERDLKCGQGSELNICNSFWFTIGSLLQQGSNVVPKALSTRTASVVWWFFAIIMISSYTANLAAFLTVQRMDSPIESAEDLARQTKIKYGTVYQGSTYSFFKNSRFSTYQRMWSFMQSTQPSPFTSTTNEGLQRVLSSTKGDYAFMMESLTIEYQTERHCELMQVGGLLEHRSYAIALPPQSPYRNAISGAILKLKESGKIQTLKNRWWKDQSSGVSCGDYTSDSSSAVTGLGLANIGGVFVVLLGGMGVACVIAVGEILWISRKASKASEVIGAL